MIIEINRKPKRNSLDKYKFVEGRDLTNNNALAVLHMILISDEKKSFEITLTEVKND